MTHPHLCPSLSPHSRLSSESSVSSPEIYCLVAVGPSPVVPEYRYRNYDYFVTFVLFDARTFCLGGDDPQFIIVHHPNVGYIR